MSYFNEFDKKETKEGNIRRVMAEFFVKFENDKLRICTKEERAEWDKFKKEHSSDEYAKWFFGVCGEKKREELIKVMVEFLTDEEARLLLKAAGSDEIDDKFWFSDDSLSDKEKFLLGFYYEVLPTVMSVFNPRFDAVRVDFLKYFILFDNFAEECRYKRNNPSVEKSGLLFIPKAGFEAFKRDNILKKLETFHDISALYKLAADEITGISMEKYFDRNFYQTETEYLGDRFLANNYNNVAWRFYRICKGILNNTAFLKAALDQNLISARFVFKTLADKEYLEKSHEILYTTSKMLTGAKTDEELKSLREEHKNTPVFVVKIEDDDSLEKMMSEHASYDNILHHETKEKLAEIFFADEEMKNYLADGDVFKSFEYEMRNREFFFLMMKLNPEYEMPIIMRVAEREVKKIFVGEINYDIDFISCHADVLVSRCRRCCGEDAIERREVKLFLLGLFLRDKMLYNEHFKKMPELFQQLAIVEQMRSVFKKAEIAVVPDLPETDIDKDKLKKDVDKFMSELKKIAKSGGKPSDYYAGEFTEVVKGVADSASWLTSIVFDVAVSFLKDSFGTWKAVKPMLAIFRNLREQAYSIDMEHYDYERYIWAFVPLRITPLLGSLEGEDAADICEEWFKHLAGELKSADDFAINKRKENPENVPEEFKEGYDIKVIEPHPLWRVAYCEAAGDLRVNLNGKPVFNHLKKNDIDKNVQEAAKKTLERIGKIKGKFDSGSRKRALLNAWWWYRVAHLKSLGIDFDWVAAQNLKSKEVKINYPKD